MAVTVGNVPAGETSAASADIPMFVANNCLEDYTSLPQWRWDVGDWLGGSDKTDPNFPTYRAFDRQGASVTAPLYSAGSSIYTFLIKMNPGSDGLHTIDSVMIWNHNLATIPGTTTVQVQFADDGAFTAGPPSNLRTVVTFTVGNGQRLWSYSLGTNNRYSTVQFARLLISTNQSNFSNIAPSFGEVFFGRRRQMSFPPDVPWENKGLESDVIDFKSHSGVVIRYVRSKGRRIFTPTFRSAGVDARFAINQETELRSMWRECNYGSKPFIFDANPSTNDFPHVVLADPSMNIPILGPFEREARMSMSEVAPYVQSELATYPH